MVCFFFGHSAKWVQFHLEVEEGLKIWWVGQKYLILMVHTDFTFNSTKTGRRKGGFGGGMGQITPPGPTALIQFRFIGGLDHLDVISFLNHISS